MEENTLRMITRVTHNTRLSERMIQFGISLGEPLYLNLQEEQEIMQYLADIIQKDTLQVQEYIICRNHLHLIIQCENSKRDNIVRKLKGKTTQLYKKHHHITTPFHLRAQKYDAKVIHNEKYLHNALKYVKYNRLKHGLPDLPKPPKPPNKEL